MNQSERKKMLANQPYLATDPELVGMYRSAQILLDDFNRSSFTEIELRQQIVRQLFGSIDRVSLELSNLQLDRLTFI